MSISKFSILALLLFGIGQTLLASPPDNQFQEQMRGRLETVFAGTPLIVGNQPLHAAQALVDYYNDRSFRPLWNQDGRLTAQAHALAAVLNRARNQGLDPATYHSSEINGQIQQLQALLQPTERLKRLVDLDLLLSDALLSYSSHLAHGQIDPETMAPNWTVTSDTLALLDALSDTAAADIDRQLAELAPEHYDYRLLLKALAQYYAIQSQGGWLAITSGYKLTQGDIDPTIKLLRTRLAVTGDLDHPDANDSERFDPALTEAVMRFQRRQGLKIDGVVGPATLRSLNIPVAARIDQLLANLERWRWLPSDLGQRYIMVNIAGFELYFVSDNRIVLKMPVVVGKTYRKTPVFSGKLTYLVVNPSWNVPHSIAVKDKLSKIKKNPRYLQQHQMKLYRGWGADARKIDPLTVDWTKVGRSHFPYHIVQSPGPQNALGKIKFMFPNKYNVYLHDTSEPWLFNKTERSFSSGCIRVENPHALANRVLENNTNLSQQAIMDLFNQEEEKTISLKHPIPVHILYRTAWVDDAGKINFRRDIYQRDENLIKALQHLSLRSRHRAQKPAAVNSVLDHAALDDAVENELNRQRRQQYP